MKVMEKRNVFVYVVVVIILNWKKEFFIIKMFINKGFIE